MIDPCLHGVPVGEAPRRLEDDGGVGAVLGVGVLGERLPLVELPGAAEPVLLPELHLLLDAHGRGVTRAVVVTVLGHRQLVGPLEKEKYNLLNILLFKHHPRSRAHANDIKIKQNFLHTVSSYVFEYVATSEVLELSVNTIKSKVFGEHTDVSTNCSSSFQLYLVLTLKV